MFLEVAVLKQKMVLSDQIRKIVRPMFRKKARRMRKNFGVLFSKIQWFSVPPQQTNKKNLLQAKNLGTHFFQYPSELGLGPGFCWPVQHGLFRPLKQLSSGGKNSNSGCTETKKKKSPSCLKGIFEFLCYETLYTPVQPLTNVYGRMDQRTKARGVGSAKPSQWIK